MSPHEDDTVERRLLQFLNWISSDTPIAAKRYLQLHAKVVVFFQNNQAGAAAERLADKTLDGVAAYLAQGNSIDREKLEGFVFQRARWVRNDYFQEQKRRGEMPTEVPAIDPPPKSDEELQQRLKDCLQKLDDKDRHLVLEFYAYGGRQRIEQRKNLAGWLQVTEATLRVRAHRIRARLRKCLDSDTKYASVSTS
jgi:DNA-directed RNA polymerase specialized sigma24 family protein